MQICLSGFVKQTIFPAGPEKFSHNSEITVNKIFFHNISYFSKKRLLYQNVLLEDPACKRSLFISVPLTSWTPTKAIKEYFKKTSLIDEKHLPPLLLSKH